MVLPLDIDDPLHRSGTQRNLGVICVAGRDGGVGGAVGIWHANTSAID
jgi:hypothetical protein